MKNLSLIFASAATIATMSSSAFAQEQKCTKVGHSTAQYIAKAMESQQLDFFNITSIALDGRDLTIEGNWSGETSEVKISVRQNCDGDLVIKGEEPK